MQPTIRRRDDRRRLPGARRRVAGLAAAALTVGGLLAIGLSSAAAASTAYTVSATIGVGSGPDGVAADPATGTVYVANQGSDNVSVIDEATAGRDWRVVAAARVADELAVAAIHARPRCP